ncbi:MAG: EamA family transporter, partial [Terriglobales bacterium]
PLLLAFVWRRKLAPAAWLSTALALAGLYFLVAAPGAQATVPAAAWRGNALTLGCALAFAFHIVILGEWAPRLRYRDLAALMVAFAAVFTWLLLPPLERPHWHFTLRLGVALGITAVLATAAAFAVQAWAQQFTPATHTAVVFAFEPVFAWLASAIGWHERLSLAQFLGAGLIVAAMVVVEYRPGAWRSDSG